MKKFTTLLWLIAFSLAPSLCSAQIYLKNENQLADSLSYHENFDYFIKNIDKTKFKTNVLYDRVVPFAKLFNYNPENPKDTSSYQHFIQAYYEIYLASFQNSNLKTFREIKNKVKETTDKSIIPIGIINFEYNYMDSTAFQDGTLSITNKQLHKNPNSPKSFIETINTLVVAILQNKITQGTNTFTFTNDFIFTNRKDKIESLHISFGNSIGDYTIKTGESVNINITSTGKLPVTYKLILKNGKVLNGYSTIEVQIEESAKMAIPGILNCDHQRVESFDSYTDYTGVSKKGIADMYFYYSNCNNPILQKPIIIFDGFDPGDVRKEDKIYSLMNKTFFLADKLRSKGYDVVIVNFPNGADYMVRNAYAAIEVIRWVNQHKTTNNKLVIVGPSMGGVISRFALAKMEKDGEDHQTGLWVSFDAPHQGANIAIGDQYFLDFFGRNANNAGALEGLDKINSPAAQQLLVDHYNKPWDWEKPRSSFYRTLFLYEQANNGLPNSKGYPQNLRKIALINGSGIGNNQEGIDNNNYLLEMKKQFLFTVALGQVKTSADPTFSSRWVLYAYLASPAVWTQRWSQPSDSPYFNTSFDKAPGGYYPTQSEIATGNSDFTVYYKNHSFIPSVSALDLKYPYLKTNILERNIIENRETPFEAYYAPNENQEHISFSAESVQWLESQLGTNWELNGSSTICTSDYSYTIKNLPSDLTVTWSSSPSISIVSGQGTNNLIVHAIKNTTYPNDWIQATTTNPAFSNISLKKDITAGPITSDLEIQLPKVFIPDDTEIETINGNSDASVFAYGFPINITNYNWTVNDGLIVSQDRHRLRLRPVCTGTNPTMWITVDVTAKNYCGTASATKNIRVNCTDTGPVNKLIISPNPACDNINVEISDTESSTANDSNNNESNSKNLLSITNSNGFTVIHERFHGNKHKINISSLDKGLYTISIIKGNKKYSGNIIKE